MARFNSLDDWLTWQEGFHPQTIDLGLERAASVFNALNPEGLKPPTVIVAGTNGKGSCIAFLEAIYRAQGYRVGTYTSPHILKYNERIKIDGECVSDALICEAFERIDAVRINTSLSYFEFGTLAALDIFWRSDLDVQLLEVGLGGRLDAVNILDADVALVTSISIDHVDWLGETRNAIAYEKAGVFRPNAPAIVGDLDPPTALLQQATARKSPLLRINHEYTVKKHEKCWDWQCKGDGNREYLLLPEPGLKGEHQYRNAATVLTAITELAHLLPVTEASIRQGLQDVSLKGRFQLIAGDTPVLLDVAHNPQAVSSLLDYLQGTFPETRIVAVFSMMKDKDIKGVVNIIKPVIDQWFIAPISYSRTASELVMRDCFKYCEVDNVSFGYKNFSQAYAEAEINAKEGDLILVFGSFFLVSAFLAQKENE